MPEAKEWIKGNPEVASLFSKERGRQKTAMIRGLYLGGLSLILVCA